ncbi:FGGY-family carbohydrate kinase [Ravibacter arvi]|uniref:FGGY-family carbohydrate kinase n=1 Tax=Ravibacter arvi TaxID=2051041 RepID=A0ABP8LWZ8_9BACT
MYLIGFDLGSSSVKASLLNAETGETVASAYYPKTEMRIEAPEAGFAEQHPELWWENACRASQEAISVSGVDRRDVKAVGISYQMHGLVVVDRQMNVLRPSIIWCDSRAVEIGNRALKDLGDQEVLKRLLNSPGNFTASKLAWVKANEPGIYAEVDKFMLPGDYLAARMTGEVVTTPSGLSEGVLWDFVADAPASMLLDHYGFDHSLLPRIVPTFSEQGFLTRESAELLGLNEGTPVTYRAGDQPNNAFSLNVLEPGEVAATGGTSGVVYGVSDQAKYDPLSRVNTFLHVTKGGPPRYGVLLCINGTGSLYSWLRNHLTFGNLTYAEMNKVALEAPVGAEGLMCLPFGNGAERVLLNANPGGSFHGLEFNRHGLPHFLRAAQEGIVFALYYGMEIMENVGVRSDLIRAGEANMFLSPLFRQTFANISGAVVELYNTDGATGAARGAGLGAGVFKNRAETFHGLQAVKTIHPDLTDQSVTREAYARWKKIVENR